MGLHPSDHLSVATIQPDILLAFELDGELKAHRLRSPSLHVRPHSALRLLAFAWPAVHPKPTPRPFDLLISAVNSGFGFA